MRGLLFLWLPFVVLMGIWPYFTMKMRKSGFVQEKMLEKMDDDLAVRKKTSSSLVRIATALE